MIRVPIFVKDINISLDFYCKKLPFKLSHEINENSKYFSIEGISSNYSIQVSERNEEKWDAILADRSYWVQFYKADVWDLYKKISGKIPEHDGPAEKTPNGHIYGIHECPGGAYASIYDPFGTRLDFFEW